MSFQTAPSTPRPSGRRRPRRLVVGGVALGVLATLSACGEGASSASSSASGSTSTAASPSPSRKATTAPAATPGSADPAPVPAAFRFDATTVGGAAFDGSSLAGRPAVLWFWAPWCSVCRSQIPTVSDLAETYGDRITFVGVGSLDSGSAIEDFAADAPGPLHLQDASGDLYRHFGIAEQSSFIVYDASGREVLRTGYGDDDALAGVVEGLVG